MPRFFTSSAGAVWSSLTSPGRRMHCVIPRKKTGISVPPDFFLFFCRFWTWSGEFVPLPPVLCQTQHNLCPVLGAPQTSLSSHQPELQKTQNFYCCGAPCPPKYLFFFRVSASLAPGYLTQVLFRWKIKAKTRGVGFSSTLVPSAPKNLFGKKNVESTNVGFEL